MITFVVTHFDLPDETVQAVATRFGTRKGKQLYAILKEAIRYVRQHILVLFQSACLFHPDCRCVLLTDQETEFDYPSWVEVIRYTVDVRTPIFSRTQTYKIFLQQTDGASHLAFLDTDILVQDNLESLFEQEFDLAFTFRNHPYPINEGVIFVHREGVEQGRVLMSRIYDAFAHLPKRWLFWSGGQHLLKTLIPLTSGFCSEPYFVEVDGARILLLPASIYNFSAHDKERMGKYLPEKKLLHFKGARKEYMIRYWEYYLRPLKKRGA